MDKGSYNSLYSYCRRIHWLARYIQLKARAFGVSLIRTNYKLQVFQHFNPSKVLFLKHDLTLMASHGISICSNNASQTIMYEKSCVLMEAFCLQKK